MRKRIGYVAILICLGATGFAPTAAFGQGDVFGQNLFLFSTGDQTDIPQIHFANRGANASINSASGHVWFETDEGNVPLSISAFARDYSLRISNGFVTIRDPNQSSDINASFRISADNFHDFENAAIHVVNRKAEMLRTMFKLTNNGATRFEFENTASDQTWAFQTNNSDGFLINRLGSGGNEFSIRKSGMVTMGPGGKINFLLDPAGNLQIDGTLTQLSDRNRKEHFEDVDGSVILESIARLPITSWRYKDDPQGIRHIGPVSQDFHREFQVGLDEKSIATVDADGVALAAIQALKRQLDQLQASVEARNSEIAHLEDVVSKLRLEVSENVR